MRLSTDAKLGAVLTAACITLAVSTHWIESPGYSTMSASVFPRAILVVLTPLCFTLFIKGLRDSIAHPPTEPGLTMEGIRLSMQRTRNIWISYVLFFLLVWTMPYLGFPITAALYVTAMAMLLGPKGKRQIPVALALAFFVTGGIFLVFRYVLLVLLPEYSLY